MKRAHGAVEAAVALRHLGEFDTLIDVRSPREHAEDHIPGAINCPVLDDVERAEVGTLDRQQSSFEARRRGAAMVARNIARHLETRFAQMPREWQPLVYCWRGGQRSAAMLHVLSLVGWRVSRLAGGYQAYRRVVLADLESLPPQLDLRVISGPTGSGKSRLLGQLAAAGVQVLDLEALASHRGSVLGDLPAQPQPGQKRFESLLWQALRGCDPVRPVYVESESRMIGTVRLPNALLARMRESPCIRLEVPLPARVRLLRAEYAHFEEAPDALRGQLDRLVELHGRARIAAWKELLVRDDWDALVECLLREHYDPAYRRSLARNFAQSDRAQVLAIPSEDTAAYTAAARSLADG